MAQVIDYPEAPQGEVLRYNFAFYGTNYERVNIREYLGPASLDSRGLVHSDRLLFSLTYWARMIHNLGRHSSANTLIDIVRKKGEAVDNIVDGCDDAFSSRQFGYEIADTSDKPNKTWNAVLNRGPSGTLVCEPSVSLFGDVAAMSISSTLVLFNRTMRLATPGWRDAFLVGLGAMIYYYKKYDHSKVELLSVAPNAAWETIQSAILSVK